MAKRPSPRAPVRAPTDVDPEKYPNLAAREDLDRARHIQAAEEMGATHKQAVRHADEEVGGH